MGRPPKLPPGMQLRGSTYYACFRAGGRLIRQRLGKDRSAAKTILSELRNRAEKGEFGIVDNDYPWEALKAEFLRAASQSVRNPKEYARDLARFESYCRVGSVRQIDQQYVVGYREWRLSQTRGNVKQDDPESGYKADPAKLALRVSPRTVNKEVATLRAMLNHGVRCNRIASNPITGVKPLRNERPRKERRALTLEEVTALFEKCSAYLLPPLRLFATTGLRHDELVGLRFEDIDFEGGSLIVRAHRAKNHKEREVPLDDATLGMLKELRARAEGRAIVFVGKAGTPMKNNLLRAFYAACRAAGIDDARPGGSVDIHSLRVTFATLSLEHGASPKAVQAILGHSTLALTMNVYAKATEKAKREAIAALPFAKITTPAHVVSMPSARNVCAIPEATTEVAALKVVAS